MLNNQNADFIPCLIYGLAVFVVFKYFLLVIPVNSRLLQDIAKKALGCTYFVMYMTIPYQYLELFEIAGSGGVFSSLLCTACLSSLMYLFSM